MTEGNGYYKTFYPNGQVDYSIKVKDGGRYDTAFWYYDNGQLKQVIEYQYNSENALGLRLNAVAFYTKDGKSMNLGSLKNGTGTLIVRNDNGDFVTVVFFENGEKKPSQIVCDTSVTMLSEKFFITQEDINDTSYSSILKFTSNTLNDIQRNKQYNDIVFTGGGTIVELYTKNKQSLKKLRNNETYTLDLTKVKIGRFTGYQSYINHNDSIAEYAVLSSSMTITNYDNHVCNIYIKARLDNGCELKLIFTGQYKFLLKKE
jgi:antitoxin component YwqK of YwqJK toxin-antitoxin module